MRRVVPVHRGRDSGCAAGWLLGHAPGITPPVAGPSPLLEDLRGAIDALVAHDSVSGSRADTAALLDLAERARSLALRELAEMDAVGGHLRPGVTSTTASWLRVTGRQFRALVARDHTCVSKAAAGRPRSAPPTTFGTGPTVALPTSTSWSIVSTSLGRTTTRGSPDGSTVKAWQHKECLFLRCCEASDDVSAGAQKFSDH